MAKRNRNSERDERRERIESMRRESERAERRRSLAVVAVCVVVALVIGGLTGWKIYQDNQQEQEVAGTDLDEMGASSAAAGCEDVLTEAAEGAGQHEDGQAIDYADSPPAFGAHWSAPAEFERKFYTSADRPELERLVHNLEHGYTIAWYDDTVAEDPEQLQVLEDIAGKFEVGDVTDDIDAYNDAKLLVAPWTADDGRAFPGGGHVALTHWAAEGEDAVEPGGMGVWQYCDQPSGEAVQDFMAEFPASNTIEPNGA